MYCFLTSCHPSLKSIYCKCDPKLYGRHVQTGEYWYDDGKKSTYVPPPPGWLDDAHLEKENTVQTNANVGNSAAQNEDYSIDSLDLSIIRKKPAKNGHSLGEGGNNKNSAYDLNSAKNPSLNKFEEKTDNKDYPADVNPAESSKNEEEEVDLEDAVEEEESFSAGRQAININNILSIGISIVISYVIIT